MQVTPLLPNDQIDFTRDGGRQQGYASALVDLVQKSPVAPVAIAAATWATAGAAAPVATKTLTADLTLIITGAVAGQGGTLLTKQDDTGGWTLTLPVNSTIVGTPTETPEGANLYRYFYDGTDFYWTVDAYEP